MIHVNYSTVYFYLPNIILFGSDGVYLSPLSDMSSATSDCLGPYFSVFPIISFVLTFLGPFISP